MKKFAVVLGAAALGASLLAGCQTAGLDQLNAKVEAIAADVDALKTQQAKLANDVAFVKSSAARANERLDSLARSYKK